MRRIATFFSGLLLPLIILSTSLAADTWQAGAARVSITPDKLMWMSGYGARDKPAEGKLHDLWAKALVLEDAAGHRAVLVTLDLVGIDRQVAGEVCSELEKKYGLKRSEIALNCSHTHCGPVVGRNLGAMYFFGEDQWKLVDEYTTTLQRKIVAVVGEALGTVQPATITWDAGYAGFAVNRRNNKEVDVTTLREAGQLKGPIDHDVPVLAVRDPQGRLLAVAFGYACHSTVLSFYQWCGDYPGFAQIELEKMHPSAVALFWAGCGADQNPLPRRTVEIAESYGRRLAQAVDEVLGSTMQPLGGELRTSYAEIDLPFDKLPTREQLEQDKSDKSRYIAQRAKLLAEKVDAGMPLSPTYPYPVQTWKLGPELRFVTLGGEVVVDYAVRLKHELDPRTTWMAGYTNDVMAYIPSRRVLLEGGYEGASAMIYYGLPTSWAPEVEEVIVREVHRQAK